MIINKMRLKRPVHGSSGMNGGLVLVEYLSGIARTTRLTEVILGSVGLGNGMYSIP